jgi:hypothetical protein
LLPVFYLLIERFFENFFGTGFCVLWRRLLRRNSWAFGSLMGYKKYFYFGLLDILLFFFTPNNKFIFYWEFEFEQRL